MLDFHVGGKQPCQRYLLAGKHAATVQRVVEVQFLPEA